MIIVWLVRFIKKKKYVTSTYLKFGRRNAIPNFEYAHYLKYLLLNKAVSIILYTYSQNIIYLILIY